MEPPGRREYNYPIPAGVRAIAPDRLDLRSDAEVDHDLLHPGPVTGEKNIWFFWHSGYATMHGYTKRNVRSWHRRFSRAGWTVRVMDRQPGSLLNVGNFIDVDDPAVVPRCFRDGTITGLYARQHTSDLVRWPLLLRYGGVYADAGLMQIGDLDSMWRETVGDDASRFEVVSYNCGSSQERALANYFLMARRDNPLFARCHRLFLALWAEDGGKTSTDGMWASPLLRGAPLQGDDNLTFEEGGHVYGPEECGRLLTDYIAQGQAMALVIGLVDAADGWDGPRYFAEHVYAIAYIPGSQLINELTAWDGTDAFRLMSLELPPPTVEAVETADQRRAREIVEACLQRSFGFKLAHGIILRMIGETLGSLWRKHEGSDDVPGTYAHWLRYGIAHWEPDTESPTLVSPPQHFEVIPPFKIGPLLGEV